MIAQQLAVPTTVVRNTADRFGGLDALVERRRLLAAYRLLRNPDETASIAAIAWRCGFSDPSRFSHRFRQVFSASPTDLRRFRHGTLPKWAGAYHAEKDYGPLISQ